MAVHLITYDLRQPGRDYTKLYEAIKSLGSSTHCLDSTWLTSSAHTCVSIRDYLRQFMDANDALLVVLLQGDWATVGVGAGCNQWLKSNL